MCLEAELPFDRHTISLGFPGVSYPQAKGSDRSMPMILWTGLLMLGLSCQPVLGAELLGQVPALRGGCALRAAAQPGPEPAFESDGVRLPFIENRGQMPDEVRFYTQSASGALFVTELGRLIHALPMTASGHPREIVIEEEFPAAVGPAAHGERPASAEVHYIAGSDPDRWIRGVPTWDTVVLGEIAAGVDLELGIRPRGVEKLFRIRPGADPTNIRVRVSGIERLSVGDDGRLAVHTSEGVVNFTAPVAYQEAHGGRAYVEAAYDVSNDGYGFRVGDYDRSLPLIIDPLLASTYLGGTKTENGWNAPIVIDGDGNAIVAATTESLDFPTSGDAFDPSHNGLWDVFIAKLDGDLSTLQSATYLGGRGQDGAFYGVDLILGPDGSVYVAGPTTSSNFPITAGAFDPSFNGGYDGFIARLGGDLDTLLASTYLGGSGNDTDLRLAVTDSGDLYVSGATSGSFPTTVGAYDRTYNGGVSDMFVAHLDAGLTTLLGSTLVGGNGEDFPLALHVDEHGQVYTLGPTWSTNFPTTPGAFDENGNPAAAVQGALSMLSGDLSTLLASTLLAGSEGEIPYGLDLGVTGDVFVSGRSGSADFPTTPGAYDTSYNGAGGFEVGDDVFIARFSGDLSTLIAATFLGGAGRDNGVVLRCDGKGDVLVAGNTYSSDYPTTPGAYADSLSGDADGVIARLDEDLTTLSASTYLGASVYEAITRLCIDPSGNVYVAGATSSPDLPTTAGAFDVTYNGGTFDWGGDVFVAKLDGSLSGSQAVAVEAPQVWNQQLSLKHPVPNPFVVATQLNFSVQSRCRVRVTVHDLVGRAVKQLSDRTYETGFHSVTWNGTDARGRRVPPGIYALCAVADGHAESVKVVMME